ncbi:MAG: PEGA domain-containing protein, partial [Candidatus Methylacidiphilales bacterium]
MAHRFAPARPMPDDDFFSPFRHLDPRDSDADDTKRRSPWKPAPPRPSEFTGYDKETLAGNPWHKPAVPTPESAPASASTPAPSHPPVFESEPMPRLEPEPSPREAAPESDELHDKIRRLEAKMDRLCDNLARSLEARTASTAEPSPGAVTGAEARAGTGTNTNASSPSSKAAAWTVPALASVAGVLLVAFLYVVFVDAPRREQAARELAAINAQRGGLRIDTSPAGATVTVGGEAAATAPAHLSNLRVGTQKVTVSAEGYEPVILTAQIRDSEFTDMGKVVLKPAIGSVQLSSNLEAATYEVVTKPGQAAIPLMNPPKGVLPARVELPVGAYDVIFRSKGFADKTLSVEVKRGEEKSLAWAVEFGMVTMNAAPTPVELEVDGQPAGSSPLTLRLPVGEHKIVARRKGWPDEVRTTQVTQAKDVTIAFNVSPAQVEIVSEPPGATIRVKNADGTTAGPVLGQTPKKLEAPPEAITYELSLQGFKPVVVTAKPSEGDSITVRAIFQKPKPAPAKGENFVLAAAGTETDAQAGSAMPALEMVWMSGLQLWVGKYEVTQAEYEKVLGSNPSTFHGGRQPVENISWADARKFCDKLTAMAKEQNVLPAGYVYRLPSDAEYTDYVGDASLDVSVTSRDFRRRGTEEVGSRGPNEFGLYDVRGNVWEWVEDWYDTTVTRLEPHPSNTQGGRK